MPQQIARYDYAALDAGTAAWLQGAATRIHGHMRRTVEDAAAIGADLLEVKARLPHGDFQAWVQNVIGMEKDTAQRMMNTAALCRQNAHYAQFAPTVVYELAAPSTPEDVRRAVLAGDVAPTVKDVKAAKAAAKAGEPITGASGASGTARSQIASIVKIGEHLGKLLNCTDPDTLGDDEVEQLAYWLADAYVPGDAAAVRARALGWAGVLVEAVEAAEAKPPTENGEEDDA